MTVKSKARDIRFRILIEAAQAVYATQQSKQCDILIHQLTRALISSKLLSAEAFEEQLLNSAAYAADFSTAELREHYASLIDDSAAGARLSRAQLITALRGTEFDEYAV